MFDQTVSCFESFDKPSTPISLMTWINTTKTGGRYRNIIERFRETGDQVLKKSLPSITVGGLFRERRRASDLITPTGWVALDIDYKDNLGLPDARIVRDEIAKIVYVAYSGLSVSGKGVWALVKIKDPAKQPEYFEQLKKDFLHIGIVIDPTKGCNPNDARFLSLDPDAKVNSDFKIYDRLPIAKTNSKPSITESHTNQTQIEALIQIVAARQLNIAPDYESYRNIGFALADQYGESGRFYFHELVKYSEKYKYSDAERHYTKFLQSRGSGITISTLFYYCKHHGIDLRELDIGAYRNPSIVPANFNLWMA